jgi:hypothetical protein
MFGVLVVVLSAIPFATAQKGTFTNIADPVGVVQCRKRLNMRGSTFVQCLSSALHIPMDGR